MYQVSKKILFILLIVISFSMPIMAKNFSTLTINNESTDYDVLVQNGISYMKAADFSEIFSSEPPQKTSQSITYIKRSIPKEVFLLEIEFKDNAILWNGHKTGAYAIRYKSDLYIPIKSICKYLNYKVSWDNVTNTVHVNTYYDEPLLDQVVNVIGLNFPICLFDDLPIGKRPYNMPSLGYYNDYFGERVSFSEFIMNLNGATNLFRYLGLSSERCEEMIESFYEMDGLETREILFLDKVILSVHATSDGTYTFTFTQNDSKEKE